MGRSRQEPKEGIQMKVKIEFDTMGTGNVAHVYHDGKEIEGITDLLLIIKPGEFPCYVVFKGGNHELMCEYVEDFSTLVEMFKGNPSKRKVN
jgi:hypothetical protein